MHDNFEVKRWTAKCKAALVNDIIRGNMNASEASMENALCANSREVVEIYEKKIDELTSAYGEAMLELKARKKLSRYLG